MKIAAALAIGAFLSALLIGVAIYRSGLLIVDVQNKINGNRIYVPVPMLLVNVVAAMNVRPLQNVQRNMQPLHNINLKAAFDAISDCPNTTFVEVENAHTTLLIAKKGGHLTIHAESEKDRVNIRVPIASAQKAIAKLSAEL